MEYTQQYLKFLDEAVSYFAENESEVLYRDRDEYRVAIRDIEKDAMITYEFTEGIHDYSVNIKLKKEEKGIL